MGESVFTRKTAECYISCIIIWSIIWYIIEYLNLDEVGVYHRNGHCRQNEVFYYHPIEGINFQTSSWLRFIVENIWTPIIVKEEVYTILIQYYTGMIWRNWGCHPLPTKIPLSLWELWGARRDRGHCGGAPGRRDDRVGRGAPGIHAGTQSAPGAATVSIHRALEALEGMKPGPVGRFFWDVVFVFWPGPWYLNTSMYIYICIHIYIYIRAYVCMYWSTYMFFHGLLSRSEIPLFQVENGTDSSDASVPLVTQRAYWNGEFAGDHISGPIVLHSSGSSRLLEQWPVEPAFIGLLG